jgi:site-specific DNA-adenine methylase
MNKRKKELIKHYEILKECMSDTTLPIKDFKDYKRKDTYYKKLRKKNEKK